MIDKNAIAQAGNVLIGRNTLDIDVDRACKTLGFSRAEDKQAMRRLKDGQFFGYGPALIRPDGTADVTLTMVGPVETTHPRAGAAAPPPAAPRAAIKAAMAKLAEIPAEVERRAATEQDLRGRIAQLERDLAVKYRPAPDTDVIERARNEAIREVRNAYSRDLPRVRGYLDAQIKALRRAADELTLADGLCDQLQHVELGPVAAPTLRETTPTPRPAAKRSDNISAPRNGDLTGPEQRILNAIAWLESIGVSTPEQPAVAFLAGYTFDGGAFNNPRGALRGKGLVEYISGGCIQLTDDGRRVARFPESVLTSHELQQRVLARLPGPEQRILTVVLKEYPESIETERCAREAGYTPGAGAFNNPRGRLRSLGLIDYPQPGHLRARDLLFLEVK